MQAFRSLVPVTSQAVCGGVTQRIGFQAQRFVASAAVQHAPSMVAPRPVIEAPASDVASSLARDR
eukprot:GDKH01000532.1.p2 GENE.GDKH01000532.1~~GDKH01000532.1.p2  ORF type:complete len:65 (+),score=10.12 GDKH01000532.1:133-327(+)